MFRNVSIEGVLWRILNLLVEVVGEKDISVMGLGETNMKRRGTWGVGGGDLMNFMLLLHIEITRT